MPFLSDHLSILCLADLWEMALDLLMMFGLWNIYIFSYILNFLVPPSISIFSSYPGYEFGVFIVNGLYN